MLIFFTNSKEIIILIIKLYHIKAHFSRALSQIVYSFGAKCWKTISLFFFMMLSYKTTGQIPQAEALTGLIYCSSIRCLSRIACGRILRAGGILSLVTLGNIIVDQKSNTADDRGDNQKNNCTLVIPCSYRVTAQS